MEKRLIWDWNGTLLDDVPAAVNALNRMLIKRDANPITIEHYRRHFGFPVRPFYAKLGVDLDKWDWDDICEDFHSYIAAEPQSIRKDTVAALELAKKHGVRQCILSALRQDLLDDAIEKNGLCGFFDYIYGVDNLDGASKIDRGYELISVLGEDAQNAVMIGDTLHDAEVAKTLGVGCILVSCGHQEDSRLADAGFPVMPSLVSAVEQVIL